MDTVVIGLILAVSVLLVLVVLAQNSKGGGVSGTFGGSGAQVMGAKRTTDFLEKLTWGLAGGLLVLSLLTNVFIKSDGQQFSSSNMDAAKDKTLINTDVNQEGTETEAPTFVEEGAENPEGSSGSEVEELAPEGAETPSNNEEVTE